MDLIKTTPADRETETPQPPPSNKTNKLSFANGTLKRHHHTSRPQAVVVSHRECLKNHAASIGGHALDGCGEFMPSPAATATDPTSLKCAACGCHRNFHRRESDDEPITHFHHLHLHHHPPPPPPFSNSPSPSPPPQPQPSSYYSSAPHMLLALRTGASPPFDDHHHHHAGNPTAALMKIENNNNISSGKKRFRTKFSPEQKDKMYKFSEKLGWKMQKSDENLVEEFCNEIGVGKGVLKVWMHNNKHTLGKREIIISPNNNHSNNNEGDHNHENDNRIISFDTTTINGHNNSIDGSNNNNNNNDLHVSTNGSSSSS